MERLRSSPLCPYVEQYIALLKEEDYKPATAVWHVQLLTRFAIWLKKTRLKLDVLTENELERFLFDNLPDKEKWAGGLKALYRLLGLMRDSGVVPPAKPNPRTPAQNVADDYRNYLLNERGLDCGTIYNYSRHCERFLTECFGCDRVDFSRIQLLEINDFVLRNAGLHSRGYAMQVVTGLRSFLKFLHYRGHTATELATTVPAVANWRFTGLPKHLPAETVQKVLDACDQTSAIGRRNYAIYLLLARLGLRAGEVVALQLEDIDWEQAQLTIRSKKGRGWARLPLPADVGKALASYLRNDRPRCSCRHVFVRMHAPYVRLSGSPVISVLVRSALANAGVQSTRKGAHLFRHSLATEMLRQGASLDEIGQLLRHKDPDTTAIYAKVDIEALRRLAVAWPGGAQ